MSLTNVSKNSASFSNVSKNSSSFSNVAKGGFFVLLRENGDRLLRELGDKIILTDGTLAFSNVAKNYV